MDVVAADVPMLLGLDVLDREKLIVDNVDNLLVSKLHDWTIPITRKEGHLLPAVPVLDLVGLSGCIELCGAVFMRFCLRLDISKVLVRVWWEDASARTELRRYFVWRS